MPKVMDITSVTNLISRISGEYVSKRSIFDIPEKVIAEAFLLEADSPGFDLGGKKIFLPVGPAAGPHTQIAPNLVAAYLSGSRVFELKTVQKNDRLDINKPCIDARDEGQNTEWSTELSLEEAKGEYLRAWIAINILDAAFSKVSQSSFAFNMSVGYDLAGIKSPAMDAFIEGMRNPAKEPYWKSMLDDARAGIECKAFAEAFGINARDRTRALFADFPSSPVHSVTLSTMHGCPPEEIEKIGIYLLTEKRFDTAIKLNPTLLGYEAVRMILDKLGWTRIQLDRHGFDKDLSWPDALGLIASLSKAASVSGVKFNLKLSNTLANANVDSPLPGGERYLSGRALFPVTVALAAKLASSVKDPPPFSFCGGVSAMNARSLIEAGIGPLTVATDMLKPGGYLRMAEIAREAVRGLSAGHPGKPDPGLIAALADATMLSPVYRESWKEGKTSIPKALPEFDCFAAPCVEACPVHQDVPGYIALGAEGRNADALKRILLDNPLPNVTGTLCDHVCMSACSRTDYEGPVGIRGAKLACAKAADIPPNEIPSRAGAPRVAIVGAGPAGLSCAHYLALNGVKARVFDKGKEAGGVVASVVPPFRIPSEALSKDVNRIRSMGVEFSFGTEIKNLDDLKEKGFQAFFACTGAPVAKKMRLDGAGAMTENALEFLIQCRENPHKYAKVVNILVAGGGNTAMDSVRAALRLGSGKKVSVAYRRTREEMPAEKDEIDAALSEGATLHELAQPEIAGEGTVTLRLMTLGEKDASGRRAPVPSDQTETIPCDLLILAIGEEPDRVLLESFGMAMGQNGKAVINPDTQETSVPDLYAGGDSVRGPASIIKAVADGRRAAFAILKKAGIVPVSSDASMETEPGATSMPDPKIVKDKMAARGRMVMPLGENHPDFLSNEASRCLRCDSVCLRCVEVCPNRANTWIPVKEGFAQSMQILHVDSLCNECGNCATFCPYEGKPYVDKPTLFADGAAMDASGNRGFAFSGNSGSPDLRMRIASGELTFGHETWITGPLPSDQETARFILLAREIHRNHSYLSGGLA